MTQFQAAWNNLKEQRRKEPVVESQQDQGQAEDATMKTAGTISQTVFRKELQPTQKKKLAPVVHYSFGTLIGALYGGMSEIIPSANSG
jgi:hypothetical protein